MKPLKEAGSKQTVDLHLLVTPKKTLRLLSVHYTITYNHYICYICYLIQDTQGGDASWYYAHPIGLLSPMQDIVAKGINLDITSQLFAQTLLGSRI